MKKLTFIPNEKIGDIVFGMKRSEVREILGEYTEFKKTKFSKNTTDDFGFCHVFYDDNDCCEALELFENAEVEYNGKLIFPSTKSEIVNIIDDIEPDEYGGISKKYSLGFSVEDGDNICDMLFGKKDYYM